MLAWAVVTLASKPTEFTGRGGSLSKDSISDTVVSMITRVV